MGFWTFGQDKQWSMESGGEMDHALTVFAQLKDKYGDQFQLIVEDQSHTGEPESSDSETVNIHIKIIVDPPSEEIESQIATLGLIYVEIDTVMTP